MIASAITMIALAITTATAYGASTRAEYVAQVEPICQTERSQEKAVIRKFEKLVRQLEKKGFDSQRPSKPMGRLAVRAYDRLAAIQRNADAQISILSPAPGDQGVIAEWLQLRVEFTATFQRSAHVWAHGKLRRFKQLIIRSFRIEARAYNVVQPFGFTHCSRIFPGF